MTYTEVKKEIDSRTELSKQLNQPETEKRGRGQAIIDQLISDIKENDWYCIQNGSECDLHEWEKALLVAGLESLLESDLI